MKRATGTRLLHQVRTAIGLATLATLTVILAASADTPDIRLSHMGPDGDTNFYAQHPAVACASSASECLVVWAADDDTGALVDNEFEIYAQRVDTATGAPLGTRIRVTSLGTDGDTSVYARDPAVVYNSADEEYFVVWAADEQSGTMADNENEIFGQRLNLDGTPDGDYVRLSSVGADGNPAIDALEPSVAYNSTTNEYLVVWWANDTTGNGIEIYGQRVSNTGTELGTDDFRISDMGASNSDSTYRGHQPAIAYNSAANEYLVVWEGDDDTAPLVNDEYEIFGQRLGANGTEVGVNDFRISDMGPDGHTGYAAQDPAVSYNNTHNQYLVAWAGSNGDGTTIDYEVHAQWLTADGTEIWGNDIQISSMGPDGDADYRTFGTAVTCPPAQQRCLVVWRGEDNRIFDVSPLVDDEMEIFGQWLDAIAGEEFGDDDFRISKMGPDGEAAYDADHPAVAAQGNTDVLVVWQGDDDDGDSVEGEIEVFANLFAQPTPITYVILLPVIMK